MADKKTKARLESQVIKVLVKALTAYHKANRLHHDEDARLYALSKRALALAGRLGSP